MMVQGSAARALTLALYQDTAGGATTALGIIRAVLGGVDE